MSKGRFQFGGYRQLLNSANLAMKQMGAYRRAAAMWRLAMKWSTTPEQYAEASANYDECCKMCGFRKYPQPAKRRVIRVTGKRVRKVRKVRKVKRCTESKP